MLHDRTAQRSAILVTHTGRSDTISTARHVIGVLHEAGVEVYVPDSEVALLAVEGLATVPDTRTSAAAAERAAQIGPDFVLVLGGDGTFLRACEYARPAGAPILGVNLGHVGFLAEAEPDMLDEALARLLAGTFDVEERMTLEVDVILPGTSEVEQSTWALNEASLERSSRERILEVAIGVDGHPLTSFGCDGVLCATPTGSTAYAFSAGGPVVWPHVEAILVVPNAAHALFARPLVIANTSLITIDIAPQGHDAVIAADGRRVIDVPAGSRVIVRPGSRPIRIARFHSEAFADRLVAKFHLPTTGFRSDRR